jgi:endonuclease/exonuclease/phosphatase family metal-dependent hydrolase
MSVLVRSWNLFHGNTWPPQRRAFLDEMIALATADDPDVLCLQEVPAWALGRFAIGDVASRPPFGTAVGRLLTAPNHGLIRSAFAGQGNALWLSSRARVIDHHVLALNPRRFRAREARALDLTPTVRAAWAKERRIVQAVRLSIGKQTLVVANTHCTSYAGEPRLADVELMRAAWFADSVARREDVLVLAGDFNARPGESAALVDLAGPEWGFSAAGPGIDHVLVGGAQASPVRVWPDERRRRPDGTLLSDHAPVEVEIE